jgi:hypothetical protein
MDVVGIGRIEGSSGGATIPTRYEYFDEAL